MGKSTSEMTGGHSKVSIQILQGFQYGKETVQTTTTVKRLV